MESRLHYPIHALDDLIDQRIELHEAKRNADLAQRRLRRMERAMAMLICLMAVAAIVLNIVASLD